MEPAGPAGPRAAWSERLRCLLQVLPVLLVFVVVIVGAIDRYARSQWINWVRSIALTPFRGQIGVLFRNHFHRPLPGFIEKLRKLHVFTRARF